MSALIKLALMLVLYQFVTYYNVCMGFCAA